jgi:hypothetical protein
MCLAHKSGFWGRIGVGAGINLFVLILALALLIKRPQALFENPISKRWILYLLICAIAVLYSPVRGRGVRLFLNLLSYYCMLTIPFVLINRSEDKKFWLKVLLFSTILPVCFANVDLLHGGTNYPEVGMRIQGSFSHPNILAFYLVLVMTLVFSRSRRSVFLNKPGKTFLNLHII